MDFPSDDALRWIVRWYAELNAAHGDVLRAAELVEPNGRFFPDAFTRDAPSVVRLFQRMRGYSPLAEDLPIELAFVEADESGGACGSGACGTGAKIGARDGIRDLGDRYRVELLISDTSDPIVLTTAMARAIGALVLSEGGDDVPDIELGAVSELAATACGFGILLTSGAAVYAKGCGGLRMHQATRLSVEEHAVALALHLRVHGSKPTTARAHLETTQREAFDEALRWVDSNRLIVETLRERPAELTRGEIVFESARGIFGRMFARKSPAEVVVARPKRERSEDELRRLAEAKSLVDDALGVGE
jgi:hypothetical protein